MFVRLSLTSLLFTVLALAQEVQIVTTGIDNFWRAFDAGEPGNRTDAFQRI